MTRSVWFSFVFLGGVAAALAPAGAEPPTSVTQLGWLAGCWAYVGDEAGSGESWMPPAGGQLLAVARRVQGGRVVSWEFQRIVEEEGGLAYHASPSGAPSVRFALKSAAEGEVVFENLANDFPQRVIYRREPSGTIRARIEGAHADPTRAVDYPMKRTSCERAER
jgi:hypothetical protein